MSPTSDGARPVVWQTRLADHHGWLDCTEGQFEDHRKHGFQVRALYTAADYDALRAEVERLRFTNNLIEKDNAGNRSRAEAAEAKNTKLVEVCELVKRGIENRHIKCPLIISPTRQAESLYDIICAALNEGDGE
ncbi:hypothetical protein [Lysobacter capsici]|uniref:hypothetical protein n=1 Tax=Lysobacter capsici TaxID=435897 RepID=UPI00287B73DA|nr:hypothetical protein [Lysobacter capsici]WND79433.1 hypothetical protein RJ610_19330 [Lysobacter capsici]WND84629.1 hypothetical protein RJ609_19345 [Lysobacter capsici]